MLLKRFHVFSSVFITCFLILHFGCAPLVRREPMGIIEKGGKEYEKVKVDFVGIKWNKYTPVESSWDKMKENLESLSFWFLIAGAVICTGSVVLCLCFHSERFIVALSKKIALVGVALFCFGLFFSAIATWVTWIFIAILVILIGWLIHKYRTKDVIDGTKDITHKIKENINKKKGKPCE